MGFASELTNAFETVRHTTGLEEKWVKPYIAPADSARNQFCLFLKPEATSADTGVNVHAVIELVLERLAAFEVEVGAARIVSGTYLAEHAIMDQHYGVINRISKQGEAVISDSARETLQHECAADLEAGAKVLGGHQFLGIETDVSPYSLSIMNDNIGTTKLGGGCYALRLDVFGQKYVLLNPFHPYQLVPFTRPENALIVLECRSDTAWADLRGKLTGTTNPATAEAGSIRRALLEDQARYGLKAVNQGSNGVHLSAGPLEGMVELQRFFSERGKGECLPWCDLAFGAHLAANGHSDEGIDALAANGDVNGTPAFDLTEEMDAKQALEVLKDAP